MAKGRKAKIGLLAKKLCMTQIFAEDGTCIPVTVLEVADCFVTQKKTIAKEGYDAIQLGTGELAFEKVNRPTRGHFEKKNLKPQYFLKEFRPANIDQFETGMSWNVRSVELGDRVNVTSTSKGKGFQGVIKRHGKAGGPASHGSRFHRAPGSIGMCTWPGKVIKNMKLPGHMGAKQVTVKGLLVVKVDVENGLVFLKGAVPGANRSYLVIENTHKDFSSRLVKKEEAAPVEEAVVE